MSLETLKGSLRTVPDFPIPGILFWDITTMLKDPKCLSELLDILYDLYKDKGITKVVGIESRGYILGPALAIRLGAGFVMARKPGKLPAETIRETFHKEYGDDAIEIHTDAISTDDVVLVHDDLLATGGTTAAAVRLVRKFNPKAICANFLIELVDLEGRKAFLEDVPVTSVLKL